MSAEWTSLAEAILRLASHALAAIPKLRWREPAGPEEPHANLARTTAAAVAKLRSPQGGTRADDPLPDRDTLRALTDLVDATAALLRQQEEEPPLPPDVGGSDA